jgi:hypothetical protein
MLNHMVSIPGAVKKAKELAQSVFEVSAADLRLEEIDSGAADGLPIWPIMLSAPNQSAASLFSARAGQWNGRDSRRLPLVRIAARCSP